jgi:signal transduction histidine kinase
VAKLATALEKEAFNLDQNLVSLKASRLSSRQSCMALAKKACDHIQLVGLEKAAQEFSRKRGIFHDEDLFIVVTKLDGVVQAHGGEPQLIGTNGFELKDARGFEFVKEQARIVRAQSSGWVDYRVRNPRTGKAAIKHTFVMAVPKTEYWISCGVFSEIKENAGKNTKNENDVFTDLLENS